MKTPSRLHQHGRLHNRLLGESLGVLVLLALGFVALPLAVYYVGSAFFGPYEGGTGGAGSFLGALFAALAAGDRGAWLLVLSPLLVITLLRLARGALRARRRYGQGPRDGDHNTAAEQTPTET
ncbi:MAG: hypothetical protein JJT93_04040 [Gammaproteobacteria bacterium]|nr:hypothetical protein [Gammaproteobacteria bacterium]TVQ48282.1 MAG: hypothetical protein EA371_06320 [Gammaproteobacteria bacterium]